MFTMSNANTLCLQFFNLVFPYIYALTRYLLKKEREEGRKEGMGRRRKEGREK